LNSGEYITIGDKDQDVYGHKASETFQAGVDNWEQ